MQQRQRLKSLDRFKRAVTQIEAGVHETAVLVCTDVAARGLDIPYVGNVLHYQCPFNAEVYVHRCGRTARLGRKGEAMSLLCPDDNKAFKNICQTLKKTPEQIGMFDVKYGVLDKMRPLIEQAKELEKQIH
jgi:ATP-dependent RNA helicase DDX24/MAK5